MITEDEKRRLKKLEANVYFPLYGWNEFYFHNIELAEQITKAGRAAINDYPALIKPEPLTEEEKIKVLAAELVTRELRKEHNVQIILPKTPEV